MHKLFDPAILLSLAMVLHAGGLWFWFVRRNPVRAVFVGAAGCALLHLSLQRYHSLLNSPSLHVQMSLFWLVPAMLFALSGRLVDDADRIQSREQSGASLDLWTAAAVIVYALAFLIVYATGFLSDLLFVLLLQPGLLLTALYVLGRCQQPAYVCAALAFFYAVLMYVGYAPLALDNGGGDEYQDPARLWPLQRAFLALLWAIGPLVILRDAVDRSRMMVVAALVLFSALVQFQMEALAPYLGSLLIGGAVLLVGPRILPQR
ncbi:MAG: hypothetical protein NXI24_19900 [bacterium]|nr:hypothetical protein [bacterium]